MTGGSLSNNTSTAGAGGGAFIDSIVAGAQDTFGGPTPASGVTISGNTAATVGGGIDQVDGGLVVANDTVSRNTANAATDAGGGLALGEGGAAPTGQTCGVSITLPYSTAPPPSVNNNACVEYSTITGNHAPNGWGGGVDVNYGTVEVIGSTVGATSTTNGNNASGQGAGINGTSNTTQVSVLNSTVDGNGLSSTTGFGGGIAGGPTGSTLVYYSTINGNTIEPGGATSNGNGLFNATTHVADRRHHHRERRRREGRRSFQPMPGP